MTNYDSWPIGKLPKEWQRPELGEVRKIGYKWEDPRDVVQMFEDTIADYAGCKYAVSCDCCSNALFMSLKYLESAGRLEPNSIIECPSRTYVSVPMQIAHAGHRIKFVDMEWDGIYQLGNTGVYDGSVMFTKDMFMGGSDTLQCLSFQLKKRLPIGRGGMILTNDKAAYEWLKLASYDGRDLNTYYPEDDFSVLGWHYYMTPEDAARGLLLFNQLPDENPNTGNDSKYTDLSTKEVFKQFTVE